MPSLGDNIRTKRMALGMTADDLAKKLGKSRATVYRYESSDADSMPVSVLIPLANALNTTPADLMEWDKKNTPRVTTTIPIDQYSDMHSLTQAYLRRPKLVQEEIIRRLWALDTTFSQNVSQLMAKSGDYNGFMASTKINQKTFANLLVGAATELTPDEAENIADFFKVSVVDLFFNPGLKGVEESSKSPPSDTLEQEPELLSELSCHGKAIFRYIKQRSKRSINIMLHLNYYENLLRDTRVDKFITDTLNSIEDIQRQYVTTFDPGPAYKVIAKEIINDDFIETYVNGGEAGMEDLLDVIRNKARFK